MASVVNTNVMSINAQRQLGKSQATQNEAMERLSSGLRINSAKDDAAGLAISTGFQSQITGITQAVRNANDGVSMTQTAEGSMDEMSNILQRMRELSVQSANDTNSSSNRAAIQEEVDQLHSELDRIAETTEFNGTKLLNGTAGETTLQVGANSGQTLSFSIDSVTTNDLGLNGNLNKAELNSGRVGIADTAADEFTVNGTDIGVVNLDEGDSAVALKDAINLKTSETGVTASAYNVVQGDDASATVTGITNGLEISVGSGSAVTLGATSSMSSLVETINRDVAGVTASLGDKGELLLTNDTGEDIGIKASAADKAAAGFSQQTDDTEKVYAGYIALDSADNTDIAVDGTSAAKAGFAVSNGADSITGAGFTLAEIKAEDKLQINGVDIGAIGDGSAPTASELEDHLNSYSDQTGVTVTVDASDGIQFSAEPGVGVEVSSSASTQELRSTALGKLGMGGEMGGKVIDSLGTNVSTMNGAMDSIDKIDSALEQISASRAGLGAIQNRLSSTISNLENVSQNLSASNSRIQDADFATETSKMSKAQILQQAGTSMLSQANASTQSVLSLLG
ncbi:flagellin [Psychromonas sp. SA13A]|uniref:flagellin N-terminal helical domain-containing protein n=1 Tax=Psychromonas sp. SA13A TaxID=2686346 RepID=UPI00140A8E27|nr:flagellin [Psychromonas sp. SA13A]